MAANDSTPYLFMAQDYDWVSLVHIEKINLCIISLELVHTKAMQN